MDEMNNNQIQNNGMVPQEPKKSVGLGVASMVLGILSIILSCCFYYLAFPCGLVGLILGAIGIKKNSGKGMAITGLVLSIISLAFAVICLVVGGAILSELGLDAFDF
ncbi:MAG: DUF4190 domain-containing protein [Porcipelethomonas sp.]